jgi:hypothetical protein
MVADLESAVLFRLSGGIEKGMAGSVVKAGKKRGRAETQLLI